MANESCNLSSTRPQDDHDRAMLARLSADARQSRSRFGWIAVALVVLATIGGLAASGAHGRAAKRWGTVALCTGVLAGLSALAWAGSRSTRVDADLAGGDTLVWSGRVTSLSRAGYHGALWVLELDGRKFTLPSDRGMPVDTGDLCQVRVGPVSGQVLRIERAARAVDGL